MEALLVPIGVALFIWWSSTGLILFLDRMPRRTHGRSLLAATAVAALAVALLIWSGQTPTAAGAYGGFAAAIAIWGWHELSFLTGHLTGPRPVACPEGATGWRRFVAAIGAILWHELAIAATAGLIVLLTWNAPNQVGLWTFLVLWIMRISAKLNIYLGVPNMTEEFLPEHLDFLKSHFRKRPMNLFFPLSVTAATVVCAWIGHVALIADATAFEVTGAMLVAGLLGLAILEHWFLVLPVPDAALWRWIPGVAKTPNTTKTDDTELKVSGPMATGTA